MKASRQGTIHQLDVTILGQSYLLACPEGGEAGLRAAVAHVDREMTAIRDKGKIKSRERIAVLAALNLAFDAGAQSSASAVSAENPNESNEPIDALIRRLDQALSEDGRLL
jgi:cell division protein ZapA